MSFDYPIDEFLQDAGLFIENAIETPPIQEAFASVGREPKHFEEGRAMLDEGRRLHEKQQDEYGDQYAATERLRAMEDAARDRYMRHYGFAEAAFRDDPDAQSALGLHGPRKRSLGGWLDQALTFYDNLLGNPALLKAFREEFPLVEKEKLEAAREEARATAAAFQERRREAGEARRATDARDEVLDRLDDWLDKERRIARALFRDEPEHLKTLGVNGR